MTSRAGAPVYESAARVPRGHVLGGVLLAAVVLIGSPFSATAKGSLQDVEREFRDAIQRVAPTAVICVASGAKSAETGFGSSGVIVSKDGYVLTDADVGAIRRKAAGGKVEQSFSDEIEVRVPNLDLGGFQTYGAEVVHRMRPIDSALLKIADVPRRGFTEHIPPASSDGVRVGDFLFVTGNAWGSSKEAPPATTAGVVASLTALPAGDGGGRVEIIYTSAAVNPGVNGGPVVDVEGRLIGTVSSFLPPDPGEPYQFLGKIMPMDRIRAVYGDLGLAHVFPDDPTPRKRNGEAASLETAFRHAANVAYPAVVSLEVDRSRPLSTKSPGVGGIFDVPRYRGPVSGVLIDREGWIVTSLYNLTNIAPLVFRAWKAAPQHRVENGLAAIKAITVHLGDGRSAEARTVAHDGRLGIALLKAEMPKVQEGTTQPAKPLRTLQPAPPDVFAEGRFVVAVGNPFGGRPNPHPLLAVGILSKIHGDGVLQPFRGQWQTDVAATDANCGGALVDLRGRLLGVLHLWSPPLFGRNSGIAFLVPWQSIQAALPSLKEGRSPKAAWLGVEFGGEANDALIKTVVPDSPAARAGLEAGDRVIEVNGTPTASRAAVIGHLQFRWEGESVVLTVRRGGEERKLDVVLGARTS